MATSVTLAKRGKSTGINYNPQAMRKSLFNLLKVLVTLAGLLYVVLTIPLDEISAVLVDVRWAWLLVALAMVVAGLFLRAFRWRILLRGLAVQVSFARLAVLYFVGNFFNAFLPSGFGGDAVRVLEVARDVPTEVAAGTVIVDRLTGLLMLFAMALAALPFRPADFPADLTLLVTAVSLAGMIGGFILLDGRLLMLVGRRLPAPISPFGDGPVARLLRTVRGCGSRAVIGALATSTIFNLLMVGWWYVVGLALSLQVPYTYYLLVVPILSVALLVPSVGGLGLREYLAPMLFAGAGLDPASAVALSLTLFAVMRVGSLLGAPIYLFSLVQDGRQRRARTG